ncbi:MAG TPA: glycosyltransferase [Marmoricola sp.]|nr:glycosyltransferase [Marmoricola sp.]
MSDRSGNTPLFSVVTPVYNPPLDVLSAAIESVLAQTYQDWELILVDDRSTDPGVAPLLRSYAARDPRIVVIERQTNGHIVNASNDGVAAARGKFIALLDHDDLLPANALRRNAEEIAKYDDVDYLYSDEDKIDAQGKFYDRFRKPDWSPERLRCQNYCSHLSVLRTALVREVGAFREGFEGSQDYDIVLRVTEKARRIIHIPEVLYHWRAIQGSAASAADAKPYAIEAGRRAVEEHLQRSGVDATVSVGPFGPLRIHRKLPADRHVSVVIPTRGSSSLVWGRKRVLVVDAVRSALAQTSHPNVEVVLVADEPTPASVLDDVRDLAGDRLVVVPFREKFNYSRKVNAGVVASNGDRIVVLNDDVEICTPEWLDELVAPLEEAEVGLTGAKLLFSSTAIQHVGLAFTRGGYHHPYRLMPSDNGGRFGYLVVNREVSGVTGACVAFRRDTFFEVGGLAEGLPESFNDVDFCYKILGAGYRILYMANCELFHFESQTRDPKPNVDDTVFMRRRWGTPTRDRFTPEFPNMPMTAAERRQDEWARERRQRRARS